MVVNYRRADDTIACLRSLRDELDHPAGGLQLVCVDNASGDGSAERIAEAVPSAVLVRSERNGGFGAGCNLGVEHADGDVIGLLNSDARPHRDWVRAAVDVFARDPKVGAVASKVLDWDGATVDFAGGGLTWFGMGYSPHRGRPADLGNERPADVLFGTGSAMFVRAELYRLLGGFDERFFMFYEDVDLGWRLNLRGHRVRYVPASIAYHRHHASMAGAGEFRELYLLERNALVALYKNLEQPTVDAVLPAALALAVRRGAARGGLDTTAFELAHRGDGDDVPAMTVSKAAMASVLAVDRFVELLPSLASSRAAEQAARVRSDAELRPLFGNVFEPLLGDRGYLDAHRELGALFGVERLFHRRNVLVVTTTAVSADAPTRAWELATALAGEHHVRLVSTTGTDTAGVAFPVLVERADALRTHTGWADVVVLDDAVRAHVPWLRHEPGTVVVSDRIDVDTLVATCRAPRPTVERQPLATRLRRDVAVVRHHLAAGGWRDLAHAAASRLRLSLGRAGR